MTIIKRLSVKNIRSHTEKEILLSPKTTVITGLNGIGKTSLLEAVYIALRGSSFKGSDNDILNHNSKWWRIDLELDGNKKRSISYNSSLNSNKKKIIIDDKISYRLMPKNKIPLVLFEPNDLQLLHGSPNRRRKFIDNLISQLDPIYQSSLNKYERALKQRNNLLKNCNLKESDIFVWDMALSEYGSYIIDKRINFINKLNNYLNNIYNSISNSDDYISIQYSFNYTGNIKQKMLNDLYYNFKKDAIVGCTSVGPHRHDLIFKFNNFLALDVASRGEVRSIILSLKFLEVNIIKELINIDPIILLDDVFSELDKNRQEQLLSSVNQTIITSTHLDFKKDYCIIELT